ncbi:hypothetical protein LCGC14_2299370 [marine sediment metagenome]|uniref:Uncharacterized protein n=1 Tax=marine sediment metagenome TaxID=412755 RepID=A0A0F9FIW4_9ZZZZ
MSYNFTKQQLEELAVEPNWLKRYSITTGRMVDNTKYQKVTGKSNKKIIVDEAEGSGIVFKDELTAMGKEK